MARRRSLVRRAGAGRSVTPAVMLAVLFSIGSVVAAIGYHFGIAPGPGQAAMHAGDDGAAAAGRVATGPFRAGQNVFTRFGEMWTETSRVQQLEAENRDLRAWKALAERLAERNARYEALLRMPPDAFGEGADIEHAIAAQLVLDSGGPFTRTLVANAGADHGVRVGFIAVNEYGLVGRVVSVGRRSARVLMLDDYNSRIPVMGEASRVRAVLAGQATQPPELLTRPFEVETPRLDFIVGAQSLREGERVVTSGDGGLYPRGIPVGVAHRSSDGVWRVALAASRRPIDFVRLMPYAGVETPEQAPVADAGPPPDLRSSVATIGRETAAPPPAPPRTPAAAAAQSPIPPRLTASAPEPNAEGPTPPPDDAAARPPQQQPQQQQQQPAPPTNTAAPPPGQH
ncbi:MAG TPA: rod shape-determining protein MreC [Caulobacterales bacterium]|nr:rod shape-determining protein MreC [Caulobacterales bacterium]